MPGPDHKGRGFTPFEILIALAILGLLAGVVWPKTEHFVGSGRTQSKQTELQMIQRAVHAMMVHSELILIPNPVTVATNDMTAFPDATTAASAKGLVDGVDNPGYVLYDHDKEPGVLSVNYVTFPTATCNYLVSADGTVTFQDGTRTPETGCP